MVFMGNSSALSNLQCVPVTETYNRLLGSPTKPFQRHVFTQRSKDTVPSVSIRSHTQQPACHSGLSTRLQTGRSRFKSPLIHEIPPAGLALVILSQPSPTLQGCCELYRHVCCPEHLGQKWPKMATVQTIFLP